MFDGSVALAQSVAGTVTDAKTGLGVAVVVEGANTGVITDMDGMYSIKAATGDVLMYSFVGYNTARKEVTGGTMDVSLESGVALDEVVVTALGVSREKKALAYSFRSWATMPSPMPRPRTWSAPSRVRLPASRSRRVRPLAPHPKCSFVVPAPSPGTTNRSLWWTVCRWTTRTTPAETSALRGWIRLWKRHPRPQPG